MKALQQCNLPQNILCEENQYVAYHNILSKIDWLLNSLDITVCIFPKAL